MNILSRLRSGLEGNLAKFNNQDFANASMGICALVAGADGEVEPEEISKTAQFIARHDMLAPFDRRALVEKFKGYAKDVTDDFDRLDVLQVVAKLKSKPDQASAAVKVGVLIANADGELEAAEIKVLKEICSELKLDPDDFGLAA